MWKRKRKAKTRAAAGRRRGRWLRLRRRLLLSVAFVFVNALLNSIGLYDSLDQYEFDRLVRSAVTRDTFSDKVVLVTIDDDDYRTLFNRTSPLGQPGVTELVNAIAHFRPKAVGIDLITDHWKPVSDEMPAIEETTTRLVWAAAGPGSPTGDGIELTDRLPKGESDTRELCLAIPLFQPDADGVIRRQVMHVKTTTRGVRPTMALALSRVGTDAGGQAWYFGEGPDPNGRCRLPASESMYAERVDDQPRIRFTGKHHLFRRIRASNVLGEYRRQTHPDATPSRTRMHDVLETKVVILGGTFSHARDRYRTPIGELDGLEVLGHAVESLDDPLPPSQLASIAVDVVFAVLGTVAVWIAPWRWRLRLALGLPLLLAAAASYLSFNYSGTFFGAAASFAGLPVQRILEIYGLWPAEEGDGKE